MERINRSNFIVITGGPGMGKTTVLNALKEEHYGVVEEVGRTIIQKQIQLQGTALPWENKKEFATLMFNQAVEDFKTISEIRNPVFFDRGIPDVIGYLELSGLEIPTTMYKIAEQLRYNSKVFITPPWEAIYTNDTERKQSFEEAIATYKVMLKTYTNYGYECIELPKTTVEERVYFIQKRISDWL